MREQSKRKSGCQEQAEPHLRGERGLTNVKSTRQNYYLLSQLCTDWPTLFLGFYPHKKPPQLWRVKNSGELIYSCIVKMDISFLTCLFFLLFFSLRTSHEFLIEGRIQSNLKSETTSYRLELHNFFF